MSNYMETKAPLQQFTKTAGQSWRQESVTISGNALKTISFLDTTPNMFLIQNPNDVPLVVGISTIPTASSYEFKVLPNTSKTLGRPTGTSQIYIRNLSNAEVTINLFSIYGMFDMAILNTTEIDLESVNAFDGIIRGFAENVPLPYGTNLLGSVKSDDMTETFAQKLFNAIVTPINEKLAEVKSACENISFEGDFGDISMNLDPTNEILNSIYEKDDTTLFCDNETATSAVPYNLEKDIEEVVFISNDGTDDFEVTFWNRKYGDYVSIVLKAGEKLEHVVSKMSQLQIKPSVGYTAEFRLMVKTL